MSSLYQQYYTKSNDLTSYMIKKLGLKSGAKVLEPCAGDGVFIDQLLMYDPTISVDAFELDPIEATKLKEKYKNNKNIRIFNQDTLLSKDLIKSINGAGQYDYIIANPPYGAWQDYDKRDELKQIYTGLYIKETYSTFLYLCINLLKQEGRLVFINPDTFLNLHRHKVLRKIILEKTMINEIVVFPSKFFPNVNFGYSNLSIISLSRCDDKDKCFANQFSIYENFDKPASLQKHNSTVVEHRLLQKDVYSAMDHAFFVSEDECVSRLINNCKTRVGDIASCVTGFYSGNDKHFIRVLDQKLKNAGNYELVDSNEIFLDNKPPINGIKNNRFFIPLIKGGNITYYKKSNAFLDWSLAAVQHYKTDKKARFQNSQFYFKNGIGVPMVSSQKVTASLIDGRLFDQSIVGIFPNDGKYLNYLLAFFNSSICTKLLRTINPSANNSANYIKKLPIIIPDDYTINHIDHLVEIILEARKNDSDTFEMENTIDDIMSVIFSEEHESFSKNIIQAELLFG